MTRGRTFQSVMHPKMNATAPIVPVTRTAAGGSAFLPCGKLFSEALVTHIDTQVLYSKSTVTTMHNNMRGQGINIVHLKAARGK